MSPGFKFNEWEKKGVPIRVEIGIKDIAKDSVILVRRDTNEKIEVKIDGVVNKIQSLLTDIQENLLRRSSEILKRNTYEVDKYDEFKSIFKGKKGFVKSYWCGSKECEDGIKYDTKATTRCFSKEGSGKCIYCGKECSEEWVFAIAY